MAPPPDPAGEGPPLDFARIMQTLDRHGVEYLLVVVGGAAAIGYGAQRGTRDVDCMLPRGNDDNFRRLGDAISELGARIRAEGLDDDAAKTLPANLDPRALGRAEISTWMTDAGALDVLTDFPDRTGTRLTYEALVARAQPQDIAGVRIRLAALEDIIASKSGPTGQRTTKHSPSSTPSGTPKRLPSGPRPASPSPCAGSRHRDPSPGAPKGPGYHLGVTASSTADHLPGRPPVWILGAPRPAASWPSRRSLTAGACHTRTGQSDSSSRGAPTVAIDGEHRHAASLGRG